MIVCAKMLRQMSIMFEKMIDKSLKRNYNRNKDVKIMFLSQNNLLYVWIGIGIAIGLLIFLVLFFLIKTKHRPKVKIDEQFINQLIQSLGTTDNIVDAHFTNGRVHFDLVDVERADLEALKALSTAGVFITNQTVKMLFSYDSEIICKAISHHE